MNLNMANKKRSAAGDGASSSSKRRKASVMSTPSVGAAHPLRQTSFPPEDGGGGVSTPFSARSPSVDVDGASIVSGSQVSASGGKLRKKRGRKSKADKSRELTPSAAGGRAMTSVSAASGGRSPAGGATRGGSAGANGDADAEDDDDEGPSQMALAKHERTKQEKDEERRTRGMLFESMDEHIQGERFERWHASRLSDAVVRRVINATVSQSVPQNVVIAVRSAAKVFATNIIESARRAQGEIIAANREKQSELLEPPRVPPRYKQKAEPSFTQSTQSTNTAGNGLSLPSDGIASAQSSFNLSQPTQLSQPLQNGHVAVSGSFAADSFGESTQESQTSTQLQQSTATEGEPAKQIMGDEYNQRKEPLRGPLRPEHLREAWRRYKVTMDGNSVGILGLWHAQQNSGVERFSVRAGGRRVFR